MTATDTAIDAAQWVCVRWDIVEGYHYVGPFASAREVGDWAAENVGTMCWMAKHLDSNVALKVRSPGAMPELAPEPTEPDQWNERQADVGAFYLLMLGTDPAILDPLHLVGPFPDHRHAYSWGVHYQAHTDDEGWQVLWLDDPAAPARLLTPAEGVEEEGRR